jgi:7-carboxy-7-deazaguanine synthase|uniref:7-carboxy-7-deazaguanine synthase n=1 Tax=Desulfomonile tiedjei TaxID=2358 RepID=A0A7C4ESN0_9BACT
MSLMVCEIFKSIQGESSFVGLPCSFVRLTGCNLACRYCDSTYAREEGTPMEIPIIVDMVLSHNVRLVEITGGEPLLQPETPLLAQALLEAGRVVLVETNGSLDISLLPERVVRIMDLKCPSSGECHRNRWENLALLMPYDEIKFVIGDRIDYEWARETLRRRLKDIPSPVLFSPVHNELSAAELAQWILSDNLEVRMQAPLHKYIWPEKTRGV